MFSGRCSGPFLVAVLLTVGCEELKGPGGGSADGGPDGSPITAAGQACLDMADAYAGAASRCGDNFSAARTQFITNLANGDCNTVSIRNESELRSRCFPSFSVIGCADFKNGRYDPSCAEQIVRPQ
ncbi:MAG: hypothetical protein KF819_32515 [Labilithrix sp.]|nr:hypothetical protein [Labilithrix sp.]